MLSEGAGGTRTASAGSQRVVDVFSQSLKFQQSWSAGPGSAAPPIDLSIETPRLAACLPCRVTASEVPKLPTSAC
jgi:hypothetical protein